MDLILEIILSVTLFLVMGFCGVLWFALHKKNNNLLKANISLGEINTQLVQEKEVLNQENFKLVTTLEANISLGEINTRLVQEKEILSQENVKLVTTLEYEKKRFGDLNDIKGLLPLKFKDISHEVIKIQTQEFQNLQVTSLQTHLNPLRTELQTFKAQVEQMVKEQRDGRVTLEANIKMFKESHLSLQKEAENLANALKGSTKLQGDWGEIQLEQLLQMTGLTEGVTYTKQESFSSESERGRPDFIIKLPDDKAIILDAKVSLNNYLKYVNSESKEEGKRHLKSYVRDIQEHITTLSDRNYNKYLKEESLDFVFMFVPLEYAYVEALKEDSDLYQKAYHKHIAIITPSSLLPILRTVEFLWKVTQRNKNVENIAKLGGNLHDKLVLFSESFLKIGSTLQSAQGAYDKALTQLKDGRGNAISTAEKLCELGAKTQKNFPQEVSDNPGKVASSTEEVMHSEFSHHVTFLKNPDSNDI